MRVPLSWLQEFVEIDLPADEIAKKLNLSGLETNVVKFGKPIDGIKTVKITSIQKHPDRDKLNICQVTDGHSVYQVITAANNIREGDIVVYAPVGTKCLDKLIGVVEFAGVKSEGMLLSLEDVGVEEKSEGLFILDRDTPLGIDANEVLSLGEEILEIEITPNRGDCLSIKGVAREIKAVFGCKGKEKVVGSIEFPEIYPVEILTDKCFRYVAVVIKNINITQSPAQVRLRLLKAGISPINSIVDITNYLMVQEGQPLHAFDLDKIDGNIVVRPAKDGEKIVTLDGVERVLSADDIVIADSSKALALAGIIGGENSKITENTKNILLEIAVFDPVAIRKSSKRLGISTDSSYRFERGVDITTISYVKDLATQMVLGFGGDLVSGNDIYLRPYSPKKVYLNIQKVQKVLGSYISPQEAVSILNALDIPSTFEDDLVKSDVPAHRAMDISRDIDIIEEIARIKGYDSFEPSYPKLSLISFKPDKEVEFFAKTRNFFLNNGFTEVLNYTFTSEEFYKNLSLDTPPLMITNYILKSQSVMRDTVLAGLFSTLEENMRFGHKNLSIFEISSTFFENHEEIRVGLLAAGKLVDGYSFNDGKRSFNTSKDWDFLKFKGVVDGYFKSIGIDYSISLSSKPYMHPYQSVDLSVNGHIVGYFGKLHPEIAQKFEYPLDVYIAEIKLKYVPRDIKEDYQKEGYLLTYYINKKPSTFKELSKFPPAKRDLAFVLPTDVLEGEFEADLLSSHPLINKVKLFDVYYISGSRKSLAYSVEFLSYQKSLSDQEVNEIVEEILRKLKLKYEDLELRS